MAITYVGGQSGSFAGTSTGQTINFALTGGTDAAPLAGDLVIVGFAAGSTQSRLAPFIRVGVDGTDYTLASGANLYSDDTFDCNGRVAYRFMPATPETSFVLQAGSGSTADGATWTVHVFRGVDPSTPMDVAEVAGSGTNTRLADPGAITPVTAGAWIYVMGGAGCSTGGTYTNGELTAFLAETQVDTNDGNIGAGYLEWDGLGEYNPAAFAGGGTDTLNDSWVSMTLALRPFIPTPITLSAESGTFTWTGTAANLSVSGGEEAAEFSAYSGFQPVIMCN